MSSSKQYEKPEAKVYTTLNALDANDLTHIILFTEIGFDRTPIQRVSYMTKGTDEDAKKLANHMIAETVEHQNVCRVTVIGTRPGYVFEFSNFPPES